MILFRPRLNASQRWQLEQLEQSICERGGHSADDFKTAQAIFRGETPYPPQTRPVMCERQQRDRNGDKPETMQKKAERKRAEAIANLTDEWRFAQQIVPHNPRPGNILRHLVNAGIAEIQPNPRPTPNLYRRAQRTEGETHV